MHAKCTHIAANQSVMCSLGNTDCIYMHQICNTPSQDGFPKYKTAAPSTQLKLHMSLPRCTQAHMRTCSNVQQNYSIICKALKTQTNLCAAASGAHTVALPYCTHFIPCKSVTYMSKSVHTSPCLVCTAQTAFIKGKTALLNALCPIMVPTLKCAR